MGQDIVGQKFVGQDVAGAISLGQEVSGAGGSGAGSRESEKFVNFRTVNTNFRLEEWLKHTRVKQTIKSRLLITLSI